MIDVVMPQMGESIVEGTLTKWLKKPGERVERDEPLFEISTDKVDTEIPSPAAGVLAEVLVRGRQDGGHQHRGGTHRRGRRAPPRQPPRRAGARARAGSRPQRPRRRCRPLQAPPAAAAAPPEPAAAEDAAWSALAAGAQDGAREQHRSRARCKGTGAGGRITKQDVEAYHRGARRGAMAQSAALPPPPRPRRRLRRSPPPVRRARPLPAAAAPVRRTAHARRADEHHAPEDRRAHGDQQAHLGARHHGPQGRHDQGGEDARPQQGRVPGALRLLAHLPAVHDARRRATPCARIPLVNASIDGTNIIYHNDINIGIAVALENGLIVPVIRNADEKNVRRPAALHRGSGRARPLPPAQARRGAGRHVLHHQLRQLRQPVRHARHQPAAGGDSRRRRGGEGRRW